MSPATWVIVAIGVVLLCWLVAIFDEMANGSKAERKAYRDKRAKDDMEEMLRGEK